MLGALTILKVVGEEEGGVALDKGEVEGSVIKAKDMIVINDMIVRTKGVKVVIKDMIVGTQDMIVKIEDVIIRIKDMMAGIKVVMVRIKDLVEIKDVMIDIKDVMINIKDMVEIKDIMVRGEVVITGRTDNVLKMMVLALGMTSLIINNNRRGQMTRRMALHL